MRLALAILVILLSFSYSYGQVLSGRIHSEVDGELLSNVIIQNLKHTNISTISDTNGRYSLRVYKGDSVRMLLAGFQPRILYYTGDNAYWFETVLMYPQSLVIDTVVISKRMSKRSVDSLERYYFYKKTLEFKPAKVKYSLENPFVILNPISGLVEKHTRYYKKIKAFKQMYKKQEGQRFVDSRYSPELVTKLTNLQNDSLYEFMRKYPMATDYAQQATDLEIKMWIKSNYKEWAKSNVKPTDIAPKTDDMKKP